MFTKWLDKGWNCIIYDWWSDKYVRSCSMTGRYFDPRFCFFILIMYILFVEKIKKRVVEWNKRFNLKSLNLSITSFFKNNFVWGTKQFLTFTQKEREKVLKFVAYLWILPFLNNRFIVHFCKWGVGVEEGSKN